MLIVPKFITLEAAFTLNDSVQSTGLDYGAREDFRTLRGAVCRGGLLHAGAAVLPGESLTATFSGGNLSVHAVKQA